MTETDYWKIIVDALEHYKNFIGDLDEMSFYDGEGDAKQALEGIGATLDFARQQRAHPTAALAKLVELQAILAYIDDHAPRADDTCVEPGITLSEAARRALGEKSVHGN